jgi:hypothetical protein
VLPARTLAAIPPRKKPVRVELDKILGKLKEEFTKQPLNGGKSRRKEFRHSRWFYLVQLMSR